MSMKRAFTLLELLVVIGIMGFMGTISVGGYRAMRRGMEERGVMQNVNQFIRSAYQRAQIERQPVAVYFWNETLRGSGDRSDKIRTYNFPQNRLTDHRIGLTIYSLDRIVDGDLGPVLDALHAHDVEERIKAALEDR